AGSCGDHHHLPRLFLIELREIQLWNHWCHGPSLTGAGLNESHFRLLITRSELRRPVLVVPFGLVGPPRNESRRSGTSLLSIFMFVTFSFTRFSSRFIARFWTSA